MRYKVVWVLQRHYERDASIIPLETVEQARAVMQHLHSSYAPVLAERTDLQLGILDLETSVVFR